MSLCRDRLLPVGVIHRRAGILQEARCRASVMEIFVDRFLRTRNGLVFDLASDSEVVFTRSTAGAGRGHSAWIDRCAALAGIRHPHLVELVDYGLIGTARRFEALGMPRGRRLWPVRDAATRAALCSVVSFLHEHKMSAGQIRWERVVDLHGKPALESNRRTGAPWPDVGDGSDEDGGGEEFAERIAPWLRWLDVPHTGRGRASVRRSKPGNPSEPSQRSHPADHGNPGRGTTRVVAISACTCGARCGPSLLRCGGCARGPVTRLRPGRSRGVGQMGRPGTVARRGSRAADRRSP